MRGKEGVLCGFDPKTRITPAYAGKRQTLYCVPARWQDHPRLCGEKCLTIAAKPSFVRITPAYAGKRSDGGDHPRLCGKKCLTIAAKPSFVRITPAYAGKRATQYIGVKH